MRPTWLPLMFLHLAALSAQAPPIHPAAPPPVARLAGIDEASGISYALISIDGRLISSTAAPVPPPSLTAQCTKTPSGKLRFELLADLGAIPALAFYPPWRSTANSNLFPPTLEKTSVTMEFLGYTRVKPVKRTWEYLLQLPGEMRYAAPGLASPNVDDVTFYLRYLRSLPTLRLTVAGKGSAEWDTTRWQAAIHSEPLCSASGL